METSCGASRDHKLLDAVHQTCSVQVRDRELHHFLVSDRDREFMYRAHATTGRGEQQAQHEPLNLIEQAPRIGDILILHWELVPPGATAPGC